MNLLKLERKKWIGNKCKTTDVIMINLKRKIKGQVHNIN